MFLYCRLRRVDTRRNCLICRTPLSAIDDFQRGRPFCSFSCPPPPPPHAQQWHAQGPLDNEQHSQMWSNRRMGWDSHRLQPQPPPPVHTFPRFHHEYATSYYTGVYVCVRRELTNILFILSIKVSVYPSPRVNCENGLILQLVGIDEHGRLPGLLIAGVSRNVDILIFICSTHYVTRDH